MAAAQKPQDTEVWPENHPAFHLFVALQTQWTPGHNGPIGLNYLVLFQKLDRMNLTAFEYDEWEEDIRVMELAALEALQESKG